MKGQDLIRAHVYTKSLYTHDMITYVIPSIPENVAGF
jgi:hypothetical protein